ncbi:MMPL family transporter [Actinophytocola glycyrrhizae]|uniref:MMPL family transporter n=1 Tax=Actinophytocola glycyrrhizae TaxID=2044873 RepID=A0ABV9S4S8_9PSEU
MFTAIGRFAATRARGILVVALLALIAAGAVGFTVFSKLKPDGFADPAAESSKVQEAIDDEFGGQVDVVVMVSTKAGTVDDELVRGPAADLAERIGDDPAVTEAVSYWGTGAPSLKSEDGKHGMIAIKLDGDDITATEEFAERYADASTDAYDVHFGGPKMMSVDSRTQVGKDLALAEGIAVPIILVLLVFAFGSLVAASLPLLIGAATVFGTFAVLAGIASATDVSIYSINLTTALSLGLAVDYALLMVSRFREELTSGRSIEDSVVRTVQTAGRTIVFSALTVAVALAVLTIFPLFFLRSFAYSGIGVVLIAMLTSVVILPALLKVLGYRVNSGKLPWFKKTPSAVSPFWRRVASAVTARPILCALPVIAVLVLGALPVLKSEFGTPDDRVLPTSTQTRTVGDTLREHFPDDNSRAIQVVVPGAVSPEQVTDYATTLSNLPDVARVESSAGVFADGANQGVPPTAADMGRTDVQRLAVITEDDARSANAQELVHTIRDTAGPTDADPQVGGSAAVLVDSKNAIGSRLPLAAGLIALSTFILLFLFTGSVLQPIRALVFNVLGLSATIGVLVLIFQEGWLSDFLGFTPMPLDTSMLMLFFCIAFGLSMDYEVFVLSRIKEGHDLGLDRRASVVDGLSHTGRIVSTAAVLIAVNFFAFGTGGVSFLQMFGIGAGLAIMIDATLIRGVLVPAGMRLLGRAAWWSPKPLRALHDKIGLSESAPPEPPAPRAETPVRREKEPVLD